MVEKEKVKLTHEQIEFATDCMAKWIRIREDNNRGLPNSADVDHSALLRRLLSGEAPFEQPPPLHCSYPWYSLAEGKEQYLVQAPYLSPIERGDGYSVVIEQSARWKWLDEDKGLLEHSSGMRCHYWFEEREHDVFISGQGWIKEKRMTHILQKIT